MRLGRAPEGAAASFASEPRPAATVPWREAGWCAVDLEMTGLDPRSDEIMAIGAMPVDDGRIQLGGGMYTLVRASKRSQVGAVLVHKLRLADVVDAPSLDDAIDLLLAALAGRCRYSTPRRSRWRSSGASSPGGAYGCRRRPTPRRSAGSGWRIAMERRPGTRSRWGAWPGRSASRPSTPHHALGDALTTSKLFIALASLLDTVAPQTVGSLIAAGAERPAWGVRRFGPG